VNSPPVSKVTKSRTFVTDKRGPENRALDVLREPLARKDWMAIAELVGTMQQDHPLVGIRTRRLEVELIQAALA
jgi:hypothetical protein